MRGRTNITQRTGATVNGVVREFTVATGNQISIGNFVQYKLQQDYKVFTDSSINFYEQYNYSGNKYALVGKTGNSHFLYLVEVVDETITVLDFVTLNIQDANSNNLCFYADGNTLYFSVEGINSGNVYTYVYTISNDVITYVKNYWTSIYTSSSYNYVVRAISKIGNNFVVLYQFQKSSSNYDYGIAAVFYTFNDSNDRLVYSSVIDKIFGDSSGTSTNGKIDCWSDGQYIYGYFSRGSSYGYTFTVSSIEIANVINVGVVAVKAMCRENIILVFISNQIRVYLFSSGIISLLLTQGVTYNTNISVSLGVKNGVATVGFNLQNNTLGMYLFDIDYSNGQAFSKNVIVEDVGYFGNYNNVNIVVGDEIYHILSGSDKSVKYFIYQEESESLIIGTPTNYVESYNNGRTIGFAKTAGNSGDLIQIYTPN